MADWSIPREIYDPTDRLPNKVEPDPPTEAEQVAQSIASLQSAEKAGNLSNSDRAKLTALRAGLGLDGGRLAAMEVAAKEAGKPFPKPEQAQLGSVL